MLTSHFSEMPRLLTFFLLLFLACSVKAVEPPQAGYYWRGLNQDGSSPSDVASLMMEKIPYCASYELEGFGSPIYYYKMTCFGSSGNKLSGTNNIERRTCTSTSEFEACESGYQPPVEMCSDGYPPNVYGYEDNCDRPTPKKCDNGEYVQEGAYCSVSNGVCSDYDSCYQYAISNANCTSSSSRFSFNYRDPNNWDYSCGDIDPASPDHPNNGGNADGNEYNDPQSPEPPISSGNSDPSALAAAIGLELRSDFGNVERAIRDGISSADSNTDRTIDAINSAQSNLNSTLSDIKSSIQEGNSADNGSSSIVDSVNNASSHISDSINQSSSDISSSIDNGSGDIVDSVNGLNNSVSSGNGIISSQLAGISSKLDNLKPCDPNLDPQNCEGEHGITGGFITNVMDTLTGVFNNENETALDTVKGEIGDIKSLSPLDSSVIEGVFDPLLNIIPQPQACIPLTYADQSKPYSFTLSCDFSDKFKAVFGFLLAFYTIHQLIGIIISTAQPRQGGF
ncbi:MAG: hypothetical protein ACTH58_10330 [Marinomonas foliarum]|uniref:hypothetical protein n=1 Tax=Marinomonas foliarum TaxID=491950 RepID=UPI003F9D2E4A